MAGFGGSMGALGPNGVIQVSMMDLALILPNIFYFPKTLSLKSLSNS